jgi:hypothetical protein
MRNEEPIIVNSFHSSSTHNTQNTKLYTMFHVKHCMETTRPGLRSVGLLLGCERERYGLYDKRLSPVIRN